MAKGAKEAKISRKTGVSRNGRQAVLSPAFDIVASALPELRQTMKELVGQDIEEMVIDLQGVGMIDSLGLGLIISAHNSLQKTGGRLSVVNASHDLLDLFKSMRLDQHFSVAGS